MNISTNRMTLLWLPRSLGKCMFVCVCLCRKAKKSTLIITFIEHSTPVLFTSFSPACLVSTFHLAHLASIRKRFVCQVAKARSTLDDVAMCLKNSGTKKSRMVFSRMKHFPLGPKIVRDMWGACKILKPLERDCMLCKPNNLPRKRVDPRKRVVFQMLFYRGCVSF